MVITMVMTQDDIRELFKSLSMSQGFYGRLLARDDADDIICALADMNLNDPLEVIMVVEGC